MYECTITKISRPNVEGGLRTDVIEGMAQNLPAKGDPFVMMAEPHTAKGLGLGFRYVETTPITKITKEIEDEWVVTTLSGSVYKVTVGKNKE